MIVAMKNQIQKRRAQILAEYRRSVSSHWRIQNSGKRGTYNVPIRLKGELVAYNLQFSTALSSMKGGKLYSQTRWETMAGLQPPAPQ